MSSKSETIVLEEYALRREVPFHEKFRVGLFRFIRHKPLGAFGGFIVILLLVMAIAPFLFTNQNPNPSPPPILDRLQGPSSAHWFGTDQFGRDVYSRIIYGARTSIIIGFMVVAVAAVLAGRLVSAIPHGDTEVRKRSRRNNREHRHLQPAHQRFRVGPCVCARGFCLWPINGDAPSIHARVLLHKTHHILHLPSTTESKARLPEAYTTQCVFSQPDGPLVYSNRSRVEVPT